MQGVVGIERNQHPDGNKMHTMRQRKGDRELLLRGMKSGTGRTGSKRKRKHQRREANAIECCRMLAAQRLARRRDHDRDHRE
jgi:hypothetical protein